MTKGDGVCSLRLAVFLVISLFAIALPLILDYDHHILEAKSLYIVTVTLTALFLSFGFLFFSTALPFLSVIGLTVLLTPTAQVWLCSPGRLTNSRLAMEIKARTSWKDVVTVSVKECVKEMPFGDTYGLSVYTPGIIVDVKGRDMKNLTHMKNETTDDQLWQFISKRENDDTQINVLAIFPSLSPSLKEGSAWDYEVTGSFEALPPRGQYRMIHQQLEEGNVHVRPLLFRVDSIVTI